MSRIAASPAVIFVAALTTRLAAAVFIFRNYFGPQLLFVQNESSHIASALVAGSGFSSPYANVPITATAQQPPLHPLILAGIFRLFGTCTIASAWAAVALNILAGALTAVLLYHVEGSTSMRLWGSWPLGLGVAVDVPVTGFFYQSVEPLPCCSGFDGFAFAASQGPQGRPGLVLARHLRRTSGSVAGNISERCWRSTASGSLFRKRVPQGCC